MIPRVGGDPPLHAVIFDAGLTLIRNITPIAGVTAEVLAQAGYAHAPAAVDTAMAAADAYLEATWHRGDWWASERNVRELFVAAYTAGLRALPDIADVADDAGRAERLALAVYTGFHDVRHWAAYPDVVPTLRALRAAGITLGVISDWGHGLERILLGLELGDYFAFLVVSSRVGIGKPHPGVFEMALARIGARPEGAVYIGDTYIKDVLGARAAGLAPILLDRAGRATGADCTTVRSLTEVLALVGVGAC